MTLALDESPRECAACGATTDLVLGGDALVCHACIPTQAWLCWRCGAEPETEVVTTFFGPELWCKTCHRSVDAVTCTDCECHVPAGQVEHDEDGDPFCRDCYEDDSCRSCGGSGGGDYAGIRCTSCRGTGFDLELRRRRR